MLVIEDPRPLLLPFLLLSPSTIRPGSPLTTAGMDPVSLSLSVILDIGNRGSSAFFSSLYKNTDPGFLRSQKSFAGMTDKEIGDQSRGQVYDTCCS